MKDALKTAMTTSISEVLETMFFMTIDIDDTAELSPFATATAEKMLASRIEFEGPLSGCFLFMAPEGILRAMTETFMGLEPAEVSETHLTGTISEAINMIAGNTFSKLDDQAVFHLEIPEVIDVSVVGARAAGEEEIFLRLETPDGDLGLDVRYAV